MFAEFESNLKQNGKQNSNETLKIGEMKSSD